jgi:hypothetical protein
LEVDEVFYAGVHKKDAACSIGKSPSICFGEQKKVVPVHIHLSDGSSALAMYFVAESAKWGMSVTKEFDTQDVSVISMDHYWALDKGTTLRNC